MGDGEAWSHIYRKETAPYPSVDGGEKRRRRQAAALTGALAGKSGGGRRKEKGVICFLFSFFSFLFFF